MSAIDPELSYHRQEVARPLLTLAVVPVVSAMGINLDECDHDWVIDKESAIVRLRCAKCGAICYP
jgi:hypothetical protein